MERCVRRLSNRYSGGAIGVGVAVGVAVGSGVEVTAGMRVSIGRGVASGWGGVLTHAASPIKKSRGHHHFAILTPRTHT